MTADPTTCRHPKAIRIRAGVLRPGEEVVGYDAAWCPDCRAYRDASAGKTPEPWVWQAPGAER